MTAAQGIHDQYSDGGSGGSDGSTGDGGSSSSAEPSDEAGQGAQKPGNGDTNQRAAQQDGGGGQSDSANTGGGLALFSWPRWLLLLIALVLALVAVAYRYRDRLRQAFEREDAPEPSEQLAPAPENEVERAWVELVRRAGVQHPRTRTPRDCARQAVETGYDPTVVNRLRRAFEDVRYGSASPTDEQNRVATEALARLDGERS